SSVLDPLFMLPLSTSAVTLGLGFIIALDEPPLNLRTSLALIPLAHALVAYPFVIRSVLPALRSIPKSLKESASLLGASPAQVFLTVVMPIVSRALVVGAVFALTISIGEFGATVFIARPQTPTMPLAIYRFLGQPGELNYGQAMAMSTLLMLVTAVGFLFIDKIRLSKEGEI
ncbi:MAG: ABC transporter permease subunit, partial [Deltaproteobacteria bacterium]|nr:ABC transporter permease subunit [Deltaproteobacteria bacterium]